MKQREIKFRFWDKKEKKMIYSDSEVFMRLDGTQIGHWKRGWKEDIVLLQYTGLHDKNGKEIYEGDIMKMEGGICPVIVVWDYDRWVWKTKEGELAESFSGFHDEYEVIGNIYENPKLLK